MKMLLPIDRTFLYLDYSATYPCKGCVCSRKLGRFKIKISGLFSLASLSESQPTLPSLEVAFKRHLYQRNNKSQPFFANKGMEGEA